MAYDEAVADRIRALLQRRKSVTEKKMFGGLAFMVNGHMSVGVQADTLMVRLGNDGAADALREKHTRPMDFTGKPLKSMLYVEPAGFKTDAALNDWVDRAVRFAQSLPPK